MKNIFNKFYIILYCLFFCLNSASAFEYTENDKNMFYDAFIDGYIAEMTKSIEKLNIEKSKKQEFITKLKSEINKQELIESSWNCITKYPIEQIVAASVICTSDWNKKQSEKNKSLYKILK